MESTLQGFSIEVSVRVGVRAKETPGRIGNIAVSLPRRGHGAVSQIIFMNFSNV